MQQQLKVFLHFLFRLHSFNSYNKKSIIAHWFAHLTVSGITNIKSSWHKSGDPEDWGWKKEGKDLWGDNNPEARQQYIDRLTACFSIANIKLHIHIYIIFLLYIIFFMLLHNNDIGKKMNTSTFSILCIFWL